MQPSGWDQSGNKPEEIQKTEKPQPSPKNPHPTPVRSGDGEQPSTTSQRCTRPPAARSALGHGSAPSARPGTGRLPPHPGLQQLPGMRAPSPSLPPAPKPRRSPRAAVPGLRGTGRDRTGRGEASRAPRCLPPPTTGTPSEPSGSHAHARKGSLGFQPVSGGAASSSSSSSSRPMLRVKGEGARSLPVRSPALGLPGHVSASRDSLTL